MDRLTADAAQEVLTFPVIDLSWLVQGQERKVQGVVLVLMQGLHCCYGHCQSLHCILLPQDTTCDVRCTASVTHLLL